MKYIFDKFEPWEHQRRALTESWDKPYWSLLMDYGTGKTYVIIHTTGLLFEIKKDIEALFIIAPNGVHNQWVDEQVPMHLPDRIPWIGKPWSSSNTQKFKRSLEEFWMEKNKHKLKVFSINVESLQSSPRAKAFSKNFLSSFRSLLVMDESTRIKTPGAKRTQFIINQLSKLAPYRRTLTGNEITRSPFDVYSPYRFLHKAFWNPVENFHIFKHRYGEWKVDSRFMKSVKVSNYQCSSCDDSLDKLNVKRSMGLVFATCPFCHAVQKNEFLPKKAKNIIDNDGKAEFPKLLKYKNLDELRNKTKSCSTLIRKEDCMDLPDKVYSPIYCEMNDEQERLYKELKANLYAEYNDHELTVLNKVALTTRFQQIVGGYFPESGDLIGKNNPKIDRLLYDLEDIDTDSPIIIWSRFTVEIENIAKSLKGEFPDKKTITYYGETPKDERKKIIEDFKKGLIHFFVANPAVAGTGLNLQNSYIQYYFSNSFNAEDRWQSEDRSHRGGQTHNCLYKDIFIRGTVDDTVKKANDDKVNLAEFFKDHTIEELV